MSTTHNTTSQANDQTEHGPRAPQKRFTSGFLFGAVMIVGIAAFVAGTHSADIMAAIGPRLGIRQASAPLNMGTAQQVYQHLVTAFDGELDRGKLSQQAAKGVASATGDPYTEYYTADEAKKLRDDLEGKIGGGIGAQLGKRDGKITIVRPLKDTPAAQAGLQVGDTVLAINGQSTDGISTDKAVSQIRGEVGSTVKLTIERGGESKDYTITRAEIVAPDVESQNKDGIGVITLNRFARDSGSKVRQAATDLTRQGVKGIVLDLRGNSGGFLEAGVEVASLWVPEGTAVVHEKGKQHGDSTRKATGSDILGKTPTVVLINSASASASEIVAGALKDHDKATIMGTQSYGKGSVQELVELGDGMLKVTVAKWYTPHQHSISKQGITPQKKVELTSDDAKAGRDPQLDAALASLRGE